MSEKKTTYYVQGIALGAVGVWSLNVDLPVNKLAWSWEDSIQVCENLYHTLVNKSGNSSRNVTRCPMTLWSILAKLLPAISQSY